VPNKIAFRVAALDDTQRTISFVVIIVIIIITISAANTTAIVLAHL